MKHLELFDLFVDRLIKKKTFVYFVSCNTSNAIKIGKAKDVGKRLCSLQTSHPNDLDLIFYMPASHEAERVLHEHFSAERIRGEWFRVIGGIANALREMGAGRKPKALDGVSKTLKQEIHDFWFSEAML